MRIAICDDDILFCKVLEGQIKDWFKLKEDEYEIRIFHNGIDFLKEREKEMYQVCFLDIDMPEMSGMEVAEKFQERYTDTYVLFVTNRDDLVFQAIRCQPFRFIRKWKLEEELEEALQALQNKIAKEYEQIDVKTTEGMVVLAVKDIIYMESDKHYIEINTTNKRYKIRGKMNDMEKRIGNCGFLRVHASYLVNVRFIATLRTEEVELDDGEKIPISKKNTEEVRRLFVTYMRRFVHGNS